MKRENKCEGLLNITKMGRNQEKYYQLDKEQDWIESLLRELNENADEKSPQEYLEITHLNITLDLKKRFNPREGEMLLITGLVDTEYMTQCIRTLEPMREFLKIEIAACFLDTSNQEKEMYLDQTETFQENQMFDLYFYENKVADLKTMIKEQIFLNYNQYPVKNDEVELTWATQVSDKKQ